MSSGPKNTLFGCAMVVVSIGLVLLLYVACPSKVKGVTEDAFFGYCIWAGITMGFVVGVALQAAGKLDSWGEAPVILAAVAAIPLTIAILGFLQTRIHLSPPETRFCKVSYLGNDGRATVQHWDNPYAAIDVRFPAGIRPAIDVGSCLELTIQRGALGVMNVLGVSECPRNVFKPEAD